MVKKIYIRTHMSYARMIYAAEKWVPEQNFLQFEIYVDGQRIPEDMYHKVMATEFERLPIVVDFRQDLRAAAENNLQK